MTHHQLKVAVDTAYALAAVGLIVWVVGYDGSPLIALGLVLLLMWAETRTDRYFDRTGWSPR